MRAWLMIVASAWACSSTSPAPKSNAPGSKPAPGSEPAPGSKLAPIAPSVATVTGGGGVKLRVYATPEQTAAPVLIVLHGGPAFSHHYMRPFFGLARRGWRVVVFDQRGVGASTRPSSGAWRLADYVADVDAVRAWVGAERVHLLGHSWGGLVAMAYAAAHAERVGSMALIDSVPPTWSGMMKSQATLQSRLVAAQRVGASPRPLPGIEGDDCTKYTAAVLPAYFHDPNHPMAHSLGGTTCHAYANAGWMENKGYDLRVKLAAYLGPVLLLAGQQDPWRLPAWNTIPNALSRARITKRTIERCGHLPWVERPKEFWAALHRFVDSQARMHGVKTPSD